MVHATRTSFSVVWYEQGCRCLLVRRRGQALWPLKVMTDNATLLEAWPYLSLVKEELQSHHRSRQAGWPKKVVSGQSHSFPDSQAQGGRLEPGDAGLAGVRPKDDFTHLRPMGWYLSAKLSCSLQKRKIAPLPGAGLGTGPHCHSKKTQGLQMQPQGSKHSSFPFWLCGSQSQSPGHWAGLNSTQGRKYPLEKVREWDPSLAQARLVMECWNWPARKFKGQALEPCNA